MRPFLRSSGTFAGLVLLIAGGCRSVEVTPASIRTCEAPEEDRAVALEKWGDAVELANGFLASEYRLTLPPGRFELNDDGMRFETDDRTWPIAVRKTSWGTFFQLFGFAAQERSWGFVVGASDPGRDDHVDNSLFRDEGGDFRSTGHVAALILHETTHTVFEEGTVGFWKGFAYYMEAMFLFRYKTHSDERKANATTHEFRYYHWGVARNGEEGGWVLFREHVEASEGKECTHGVVVGS